MTQQVLRPEPHPVDQQTGVDKSTWIANALTDVLSDTALLMFKTQSYHWNVVGPLFTPIHDLTERQYTDLFDAVDTIAERIRALGELAPLSVTDMMNHAHIKEEDQSRSAHEMIEQLIADNEALARRLRESASLAARHGDGATEDLMNSRMARHEEAIWMLRAIAAQ